MLSTPFRHNGIGTYRFLYLSFLQLHQLGIFNSGSGDYVGVDDDDGGSVDVDNDDYDDDTADVADGVDEKR